MKRYFALLISIIFVLSMFAGCSQKEEPEEDYFDSTVIWDRDAKEHWQNGENGEKLNAAPHELDDGWICSVCRSEIIDWGDGTVDVMDYNGFGSLVRQTGYDAEGNVLSERVCEYEYDENGNYKFVKIYEDGVLYSECEYTVNEEGYCYPLLETVYVEDGAYSLNEYDENGNILKVLCYDENSELVLEAVYEYSVGSDGELYESKYTEKDYAENAEHVYQYNEHNDILVYKAYDGEGNLVLEETNDYDYDEEGRKIYHATYYNGKIAEEIYFGVAEDDEGWWTYYQKHIVYNDDGSKIVYEYDENEELISETHYDAKGNVIG